MAKIYLARIGRGETSASEVPARWRDQVAAVLDIKGRPSKAELLERAALLGLTISDGATNPEIAAAISALTG